MIIAMVVCFLRYKLLLPCTLLVKLLLSQKPVVSGKTKANLRGTGHFMTLAAKSQVISLRAVLRGKTKSGTRTIPMRVQLYEPRSCFFSQRAHPVTVNLSVRFQRHPQAAASIQQKADAVSISVPSSAAPKLKLVGEERNACYKPIRGDELFALEGLNSILSVIRSCYDTDKLGPRTISTFHAPPVKRVKAIYGINIPTEVGAVYKPSTVVVESGKVNPLHVLDESVRLPSTCGYKVEGGVIYETESTPNLDCNGAIVHRSGDGTVPYWSLQHCRTWASQTCHVTVNEVEGATHREILTDKRFHAILKNYLQVKAD